MFGIFKKAQKEEDIMAKEQAQAELNAMKAKIMVMYEHGEIQVPNQTNVMLKKDEQVLLTMNNVRFSEERSARYRQGMTLGSIHKGHFGAFSTSVSRSKGEMRQVDEGSLTITSKRIIFMGTMKTIQQPLTKIAAFEAWSNGCDIAFEGKNKIARFTNTDETIINDLVPVDGIIMRSAIAGQLDC